MGNFFGVRRRAPIVTAQDRAILQLKQQRDKIRIYQKRTQDDLVRNKELAQQLYNNGLKERALITLRMKKCMEDILVKTDNQLKTLEQMVRDIEFTQIEVSVVEGLKVGTESLKQLTDLMNIDDIQQMMNDNAEATQKQEEISAILEQSAIRYDDKDLLEELATHIRDAEKKEAADDTKEPVGKKLQEIPVSVPEETVQTDIKPQKTLIGERLDELPTVPQVIEAQQEEDEPSKKVTPIKEKKRQLEPAQ